MFLGRDIAEFSYQDVFRLWETVWAARMGGVTVNFEEFFALAIMKQFKSVSMSCACHVHVMCMSCDVHVHVMCMYMHACV